MVSSRSSSFRLDDWLRSVRLQRCRGRWRMVSSHRIGLVHCWRRRVGRLCVCFICHCCSGGRIRRRCHNGFTQHTRRNGRVDLSRVGTHAHERRGSQRTVEWQSEGEAHNTHKHQRKRRNKEKNRRSARERSMPRQRRNGQLPVQARQLAFANGCSYQNDLVALGGSKLHQYSKLILSCVCPWYPSFPLVRQRQKQLRSYWSSSSS